MHRRGILNSNSRWQQNHWQSARQQEITIGFEFNTRYSEYDLLLNSAERNMQKYDVGGSTWCYSETAEELQNLNNAMHPYKWADRLIGNNPTYHAQGYLINSGTATQNHTATQKLRVACLTWLFYELDTTKIDTTRDFWLYYNRTNTMADYDDMTTGFSGNYPYYLYINLNMSNYLSYMPSIWLDPRALAKIDNLPTNINAITMARYLGVYNLSLQKQIEYLGGEILPMSTDWNTKMIIAGQNNAMSLLYPNQYAYETASQARYWGDEYYQGYNYYNFSVPSYIPYTVPNHTSGLIKFNDIMYYSYSGSQAPNWRAGIYMPWLSYQSILGNDPTGEQWTFWLDMLYKPIIFRNVFCGNPKTRYQHRYVMFEFVLINNTTGKIIGEVVR